MGGRVISALWMPDRIPIKLQLPGKSHLIFQFYQASTTAIPQDFKDMLALKIVNKIQPKLPLCNTTNTIGMAKPSLTTLHLCKGHCNDNKSSNVYRPAERTA